MKAERVAHRRSFSQHLARLQHPLTTTIIGRGLHLPLLLVNYTSLSFRNNNNCLSGVIRFGAAAERFQTDVFIAAARASKGRTRRHFFFDSFYIFPFRKLYTAATRERSCSSWVACQSNVSRCPRMRTLL